MPVRIRAPCKRQAVPRDVTLCRMLDLIDTKSAKRFRQYEWQKFLMMEAYPSFDVNTQTSR